MQIVSDSFAPYADVRHIDFSVKFELLDTSAQSTASASANSIESISQLTKLTDDITSMADKYITLETGLWKLGGGFKTLPSDLSSKQVGWWSGAISRGDGTFAANPILTFDFGTTAVSTVGYTMHFDDKANQYPTSIKATTYASNKTTIINQQTFSNDSPTCVIEFASSNYYKVTFEFLKTSEPYRRVKMVDCQFGIVQMFDKDSLVSASLVYGADVACETFPSRQLTFVFDNIQKKYNLINPNGLYAYLQEGQDITAKCSINGEAVNMGKFYFKSAKANDDEITAEITATDYADAWENEIFNGGSNTTATLSAALTTVCGSGVTVITDSGSTSVSMAIPQGTAKRESVRLLAQAACCGVWFDRDHRLVVKALPVAITAVDTLDKDNMPNVGGITVDEPVDSVVLTVRNEYDNAEATYTSGTGTRVKTVDNSCVVAARGQIVADWLKAQYNRRRKYDKDNRCNPAVEIGDTLTIYDAYGANAKATVTGIEIGFDGGLSAKTKAVGA